MKQGKIASLVALAASLAACGGGGGNTAVSQNVGANLSIPFAQLYQQFVSTQHSWNVNLNYIFAGQTYTGTGTFSQSAASPISINGRSLLSYTQTGTFTLSGNGKTVPYSLSSQTLLDSNYNVLGSYGSGSYCQTTSYNLLPTTVSVGSTGVLSNSTCYNDQAMTQLQGYDTTSYSVVANSSSAVTVNITDNETLNGALVSDDIETYTVTPTSVSLVSSSSTGPNSTLTATVF